MDFSNPSDKINICGDGKHKSFYNKNTGEAENCVGCKLNIKPGIDTDHFNSFENSCCSESNNNYCKLSDNTDNTEGTKDKCWFKCDNSVKSKIHIDRVMPSFVIPSPSATPDQ